MATNGMLTMMNKVLRGDLLLFCAALIWGVTFVVQKDAAQHIGAFSFTAIRFFLGALVLLPLAMKFSPLFKQKEFKEQMSCDTNNDRDTLNQSAISPLFSNKLFIKEKFIFLGPALCLGPILLGGAVLQQLGLEFTSEANSGFITTFYVILTPIIMVILGNKVTANIWVAALVMIVGIYFLSINHGLSNINRGDFLTLICAVFWAIHVICISYVAKKIPVLWIAVAQNLSCAVISFFIALYTEHLSWSQILLTWPQILWAGIASVGIAYTAQIFGQREAPATHAVIILSLEAVIAAVTATIVHQEWMSARSLFGASLMFLAVMIAELWPIVKDKCTKLNIIINRTRQ